MILDEIQTHFVLALTIVGTRHINDSNGLVGKRSNEFVREDDALEIYKFCVNLNGLAQAKLVVRRMISSECAPIPRQGQPFQHFHSHRVCI